MTMTTKKSFFHIAYSIFNLCFVFSFQNLRSRLTHRPNIMTMRLYTNFDAILFDCDGVIAETERDAHRVTFNQVEL